MLPFDLYPGAGRQLLEQTPKGSNCRWEYGLKLMRLTGQTRCAYCDADFTASYEVWLTMALDHVVPTSVCIAAKIPVSWTGDYSNTVLACAACNGFCNRYRPSVKFVEPMTLDGFYDLRDRVFEERKEKIRERHSQERTFFEGKPWKVVADRI
jgi:hypothetical protein